jgi:hypothetical protein
MASSRSFRSRVFIPAASVFNLVALAPGLNDPAGCRALREVARTLVLSERPVESHVRSILAKTGLTSRTELTRRYLQQPPHFE